MQQSDLVQGIDASSVQGNIDWCWVSQQNIKFAILKCFQGNDFLDPTFQSNLVGASNQGILTACYHFLYPLPDNGTPNRKASDQAKLHWSNSEGVLACADIEWSSPDQWSKWNQSASQIDEWLQEYLETYKTLSGQMLPVYSYPYFLGAVNFGSWLASYRLWIASYATTNGQVVEPNIPEPWKSAGETWLFWQTSGGNLLTLPSGIKVDTDVAKDLSWWSV